MPSICLYAMQGHLLRNLRPCHASGPSPWPESRKWNQRPRLWSTNHRPNGAYTLEEIKGFLSLFPAGPVAVAIGVNAFLALRKPEAAALLPDDYDKGAGKIRIHRDRQR